MITIIDQMIEICNKKIQAKGTKVGISFYVFFKNKNNNPQLLISVATWWIVTNKLDHFEKAVKIKNLLLTYKNLQNKL